MMRFLVVFIMILKGGTVWAQEVPEGTGLEGARQVGILVEEMSFDAIQMGLSSEAIQARVEEGLGQAGLVPTEADQTGYLYVNVHVVGEAFTIRFEYKRPVYYTLSAHENQPYWTWGTVWERSTTGFSSAGGELVMEAVDRKIDQFLEAYLATNQSRW